MTSDADRRCAEWTRWSLRPDCGVADLPDGTLRVECRDARVCVRDPSDAARQLVTRMALGPVAIANVGFETAPARVLESLGPVAVRSLVASDSGVEILSIESTGPGPPPLTVSVPAPDVALRWTGDVALEPPPSGRPDRLVVDVPRPAAPDGGAGHRVVVTGPALRAVRPFRHTATVASAARSSGLDEDLVGATAGHLRAVGALRDAP
ncbi:hypothetical protein [Pseudonocardia endophytica]|nr:hypothetical protein [Pseudonocardia endophytica]